MENDDVTTTRLAAMEREHARLDKEWNAIGAEIAALAMDGDAAGAGAVAALILPRELRDEIEALPTALPTAARAAPHTANLIRA